MSLRRRWHLDPSTPCTTCPKIPSPAHKTYLPPSQPVSPEMLQLLSALRHKCAIGFVGGSDLVKQQEQLGTPSIPVTGLFDYCFAENGLTAIRLGQPLASNSFIGWLGQEKYQQLVNFCLRYIADIKCPVKTGTFVEFRYASK